MCGKPGIKQVGGDAGKGSSPRNLSVSTSCDELRLATEFQSRVITIAGKDRAAVLIGGHTANAAYWYKSDIGQLVSSAYYMKTLPTWVADFNDRVPTKTYCGKPWQALPETPGAGGKILREFKPEANPLCKRSSSGAPGKWADSKRGCAERGSWKGARLLAFRSAYDAK